MLRVPTACLAACDPSRQQQCGLVIVMVSWPHISPAVLSNEHVIPHCPAACLQVDTLLGEQYKLGMLLPGCLLVGAGVLLCTL